MGDSVSWRPAVNWAAGAWEMALGKGCLLKSNLIFSGLPPHTRHLSGR